MKRSMKPLILAATLAASYAMSPAAHPAPAQAGGAGSGDRCSAPLPPELALSGGPTRSLTTLRGPGVHGRIVEWRHDQSDTLRLLGVRPLAHDTVGEFELAIGTPVHLLAGPVHIFQHGRYDHICRQGVVMVNANGNTTQQANPFRRVVAVDGVIAGRVGRVDIWVGGEHYVTTARRTVTP